MADAKHLKILRRGIEAWNEWRDANHSVRPDLKDANLRDADLRDADLTGADLTGAYLTGADLRGAYLTGAYLTGAYGKKIKIE